MLGTRNKGGRMEGGDKSTELWRHPHQKTFLVKRFGREKLLFTSDFILSKLNQ